MFGWHHQLNRHEFEQAPGDGEGQGSLVCCSPCAYKELDMTERLNNKRLQLILNVEMQGYNDIYPCITTSHRNPNNFYFSH